MYKDIDYEQPKTIQQRQRAAKLYEEFASSTIPLYLDNMDNDLMQFFSAWPDRIYIVQNKEIKMKGGMGPFDYDPEVAKAWLDAYLSSL